MVFAGLWVFTSSCGAPDYICTEVDEDFVDPAQYLFPEEMQPNEFSGSAVGTKEMLVVRYTLDDRSEVTVTFRRVGRLGWWGDTFWGGAISIVGDQQSQTGPLPFH